MSRRVVVVVCLLLGWVFAPGVASADPSWQVPDEWGDQVRGDVCKHRGDPPCHTTTARPTTTAQSTGGTSTWVTTTTDVSGTSETSAAGTSVAGTTTAPTTSTSQAGTTAGTGSTTGEVDGVVRAGAPPAPRVVEQALADTGATPLWTAVGGLVALLGGAVLLVFSRRRRA